MVISFEEHQRLERKPQTQMNKTLITMLAAGVIGSTGFALAHGGHGGMHRNPLDQMTETLKLTPDQQAKVQPIIDQAKPQLIAIHRDAMQKAKGVLDNAMAQIRPLLTPEQQKKADDMKQAHQDMHNAMKRLHDANDE
jgi:Spy/CpxP family protein refolding chaperone